MAPTPKRRKTKGKSKAVGIGLNIDAIRATISQEIEKIHTDSKYLEVPKYAFNHLYTETKNWYGKATKFVKIHGAAGTEDIPETKLKVISDHYVNDTRKKFNDILIEDPLLSPAMERRVSSHYENGFHLELESTIAFDPVNNRHLTKQESEQKFQEMNPQLTMHLEQLEMWKDSISLEDNMRDMNGVSFGQGRAASLITPGLTELAKGQLPFSVEIIHYTDMGDPIVDVGLTKRMVALKTKFEDKKICRADEIIYITRNKRGYRKEGKFLGTSAFEPILAISQSIKRIYNYDIPEAVIASYITKILFQFDEEVENTDAATFIRNYLTTGKLAFGMKGVEQVTPIQPKVDVQMIDALETKLADVALSVIGVPKSMLNREHNLNRDIATIEAIQFIKFVRTPDEELNANEYENQLFNPLLAVSMGIPLNQIPARIKIVRNNPEKDLDVVFQQQQNLEAQKTDEINSQELAQPDAGNTIFGASGNSEIKVTPNPDGSYNVKRDITDS